MTRAVLSRVSADDLVNVQNYSGRSTEVGSWYGDQMAVAINPFSAKCGQGQNSTKIPKFCFVKLWKQILPFESGGRGVSFEWSHHRILSTDSKVRTTIRDSNIHFDSKRVNLSGERRLATALCTHWSSAVDWVCDLGRDFRWRGVLMRFSPRSKLFQGCH